MAKHVEKGPEDVIDYEFRWSKWLAAIGDTIDSYTVTVPTGIVLDSDSEASGTVTVWLSGGTVLNKYKVSCKIDTVGGRTKEKFLVVELTDEG